MEPAFQIVQALYNRAVSEEAGNDILAQDGVECKSEDILLRKVLETTKAGTIAYTKVPRKILKQDIQITNQSRTCILIMK